MRPTRLLSTLLSVGALVVSVTGCAPARQHLAVGGDTDVFTDGTRSTPANCEHGVLGSRTLPVTYRFPDGPGPFPLVVFAHGFNADPGYYLPLIEDLAAAGYVVAAPTFPISRPSACPQRNDMSQQAYDITAVINHVVFGGAPVSHLVDGSRIGVTGHSDGGITVSIMANLAGRHDPRVQAYIELSGGIPYGMGVVVANAAPVLAVNGTNDTSNGPANAYDFYNRSVAPRGLLVVSGGTHTSPFLGGGAVTDNTRDAMVGFFDRFVRGDGDGAVRFMTAATAVGAVATDGW